MGARASWLQTWQPFELDFVESDGVGHARSLTNPARVRTVRDWPLG
jgi:hypothetical protein